MDVWTWAWMHVEKVFFGIVPKNNIIRIDISQRKGYYIVELNYLNIMLMEVVLVLVFPLVQKMKMMMIHTYVYLYSVSCTLSL